MDKTLWRVSGICNLQCCFQKEQDGYNELLILDELITILHPLFIYLFFYSTPTPAPKYKHESKSGSVRKKW